MVTPNQVVTTALDIARKAPGYVWGAETRPGQRGVPIDCSELVEQVCAELGIKPTMPDGSWIQARHCQKHNSMIPVAAGVTAPGALLFRFAGPAGNVPASRPSSAHVAISIGDGRTIEARSTRSGVGVFPGAADGRWTLAAGIPGVTYAPGPVKPPGPVGRGDKSCRVAALQGALNKAFPPLIEDGELGKLTEARIRAWQAERGRTVTGIADPGMLAELRIK